MRESKTIIHKRVNITLPDDTLRLLDRLTGKGERSGFLDQAVRFYVGQKGSDNLKKQLRQGAIARAARDLDLAGEWFPIEDEAWPEKSDK